MLKLRFAHVAHNEANGGIIFKRGYPRKHFIENDPNRIEVAGRCGVLAQRQLRAQVSWRTANMPRLGDRLGAIVHGQFGDAEIEYGCVKLSTPL